MRGQRITTGALAVAVALGAGGCEDVPPSPVDTGTDVRIELTSAGARYLSAAEVDLGAIDLIAADDTTAVTLTPDATDGFVDLFGLRDGVTVLLANADVEQGEYSRLRLTVEDARVELASGYTFDDGTTSRTVTVPTGAAGLLLNLEVAGVEDAVADGIEIDQRGIELVLDFDVRQSFRIQGDPEVARGITGIAFSPAIRVVEATAAGSIAGTVTSLTLEEFEVRALPWDAMSLQPFQTREATAITATDGTYRLNFLAPGEYAVGVAVDSGFPAIERTVVEAGEAVTGLDFEVVPD